MARSKRLPYSYSKAYEKKKVKSNTLGVNPAGESEAPATSFQFQILISKMGQMLKATEKPIELQTNVLHNQFSKKENAQPNRFNQQGRNQQSGSDQGSGKRKHSEHQFAGKASSNKGKKGKQLTFKKSGSSWEDDDSDDQPEYSDAYLGRARVSLTVIDLAGTKTMSNDMGPHQVFSWDGDDDIPVYLHWRVPSLAQPVEPELKLELQCTDYMCVDRDHMVSTRRRGSCMHELQPSLILRQWTAMSRTSSRMKITFQPVEPAVWDSLDDRSSYLWGLEAIIVRSLEDPDIDSKGKQKNGRMVPLVLEVQQQHMNLAGWMASNSRFADDKVTIQFYADAVRQLRSTEVSATPKSEEELQCIIKAQRDRVHPYPYLSDSLRLAEWSD